MSLGQHMLCYMFYSCIVRKCTGWYRHLLRYTAMYASQWLTAVLRKRRAQLWWWASAMSWSGSSCSDGGWSSPGPQHTPWGQSKASSGPAWHSHCWNAANKWLVSMFACLHLHIYFTKLLLVWSLFKKIFLTFHLAPPTGWLMWLVTCENSLHWR